MPGSLFERLTLGKEAYTLTEDESIRRNLERILTIRQGSVQAVPFLGLPDLNDLSRSKSEILADACAAIKENIALYEPRLTGPHVTVVPTSLHAQFTMNFLIEAQKIGPDGQLVPWEWEVGIDGSQMKGA